MSRQLAPRGELLAALTMAGRHLSTATVMFHQAIADRLEKAGYAQRADDPRDRRRVIVEVVAKRLREIEQLFEQFAATFGELSARYSDKELDVILDFMNRSCDGLHEATVGLRRQPKSTKTPSTAQTGTGRGTRKRPPR